MLQTGLQVSGDCSLNVGTDLDLLERVEKSRLTSKQTPTSPKFHWLVVISSFSLLISWFVGACWCVWIFLIGYLMWSSLNTVHILQFSQANIRVLFFFTGGKVERFLNKYCMVQTLGRKGFPKDSSVGEIMCFAEGF